MQRKLHYPLVTMNMENPVKTQQYNIYVQLQWTFANFMMK